jgi:REP element-mobilizing transposase RayT
MEYRPPKAYMFTVTTYGTRLHGDERGTVDREHNEFNGPFVPPDEEWVALRADQLAEPPLKLNAKMRGETDRAIRAHAEFRGWHLHAAHVRTNHFHIVVAAVLPSDRMLAQFKAYATRALRKSDAIGNRRNVWTEGGSKRRLYTDQAVIDACNYVMFSQGPDLPME